MSKEDYFGLGLPVGTHLLELMMLLILLGWSTYVFVEALTFDEFAARGLPILVSLPLIGLLVLEIASNFSPRVATLVDRFRLEESVNIEESENKSNANEVARFFVSLLSFAVPATLFGLFISIPVYLIVFSRLFDILGWRKTLIATPIIWLTISLIFGYFFNIYALRIPLPGLA